MNHYQIRLMAGRPRIRVIKADSIDGFQTTQDSYTFWRDGEVVAAIPKSNVISVDLIKKDQPPE